MTAASRTRTLPLSSPIWGAGLVARECAPHRLESGDVLIPALQAVLWDELGGSQMGSQGIPDRTGRRCLRTETGNLDDQLVGDGGGASVPWGGGGYAAYQGVATTGDAGGCAQGDGCRAWAGVVCGAHGA